MSSGSLGHVSFPASFTILTVCTGNICRSPAVEFLLRAALGTHLQVHSAGTHAVVGHRVDDQMMRLLPMDTSAFTARQVTVQMVKEADLVLALTRSHRSQLVELHPPAVRTTFTLREFTRIADVAQVTVGDGQDSVLAQVTAQAPRLRVVTRTAIPADDDITDPYGLQDEVFEKCVADINTAVASIAHAINKSPRPQETL